MFLNARRGAASLFYLGLSTLVLVSSCSNKHLVAISLTPSNPSVAQIGETVQFQAMGTTNHSNSGQEILTTSVTWSSSTPSIATIDKNGLATAVGCGETTITAEDSGIIGQTQFTTTCSGSGGGNPVLQSINIYPGNPSIPQVGQTTQFIALGAYAPPSANNNLSGLVTWASSDVSIATINNAGLVTAVSCGQTTITALYQGVLGQTQVTVSCTQPPTPVLQSITLYPSNPTIPKSGQTIQFIALAVYSPPSSNNVLTNIATWASSNTAIATVDSGGLVTAVTCGTTTITAEYQGVIGQMPLTVNCNGGQTLSSIQVLPGSPTIPQIGQTTQFLAMGTLTAGGQTDLTSTATWSSSNLQVATVNNSGVATAVSCGTTTILAESQNVVGQTLLTVSCAQVTSIELIVVKNGGSISSTVVSAPSGINCGTVCGALFNEGTGMSLTSTPAPSSWNGCDQVISGSCYFTLKPDTSGGTQKIVTANF